MTNHNTIKKSRIHSVLQKIKYQLIKRHVYAITGPLRVLPDFIIIGTMKSGTTSLYYDICEHPCVESASYDEIGYFDVNYHLGLNWYRSMFPTIIKKNKVIKKFGKFMTGEDTPFYFWNSKVVERIHKDLPNIKLIVILRNPIDRAYSEYQNGIRNGTENRIFEDVIKDEIKNIKNKTLTVELCSGINSILTRGIYHIQLKLWREKFETNQILVIQTEMFSKNPSNIMNDIFEFFDLPKYVIKKNRMDKLFKYPEMKKETRDVLIEFFDSYNEELFKMLGYRFDWEESELKEKNYKN
jgi:hypothetical protein